MKILEIQTHADLRKAKSHLICAYIICIACMIINFFMQFTYFGLLIFAACYIFYAVYKFSKLTNAHLFHYYLIMVCMQLSELIISKSTIAFWMAFVIICVLYICNIYLAYKMSHEMSAITDLPHFITSFKLYVISSFCMIVATILVWIGLDTKSLVDGISESSVISLIDNNIYLLVAFLCVLCVVCFTSCVSIIFVLRGLVKITYVKVHNLN